MTSRFLKCLLLSAGLTVWASPSPAAPTLLLDDSRCGEGNAHSSIGTSDALGYAGDITDCWRARGNPGLTGGSLVLDYREMPIDDMLYAFAGQPDAPDKPGGPGIAPDVISTDSAALEWAPALSALPSFLGVLRGAANPGYSVRAPEKPTITTSREANRVRVPYKPGAAPAKASPEVVGNAKLSHPPTEDGGFKIPKLGLLALVGIGLLGLIAAAIRRLWQSEMEDLDAEPYPHLRPGATADSRLREPRFP